jgi:membrane protein YdbS with pleckstrin-like domain
MREEVREPTTRDHSRMQRAVGLMTVMFWASVVLVAVLGGLSWLAAGVQNKWSFNLLGGAVLVLMMVSSAFLFWQARRADRRELDAVRRERRDISGEGSD